MDYLPDSDYVAVRYCPGCEPERDPMREILDITWCEHHVPAREGSEDGQMVQGGYLSGSGDADPVDNRRMCDLLHRPVHHKGESTSMTKMNSGSREGRNG